MPVCSPARRRRISTDRSTSRSRQRIRAGFRRRRVFTLDVTPLNDPAVLSSADVTVDETDAPVTASGMLTISDIDSLATFVAQTDAAGVNGNFWINATGAWSYVANAAFDNLNVGGGVSDTFTVTSADGTTTTVKVTINGTNDAAVITGLDSGLVDEDFITTVSGILTATDPVDPELFPI